MFVSDTSVLARRSSSRRDRLLQKMCLLIENYDRLVEGGGIDMRDNTKAVAYVRVSTNEQAKTGVSLEAQEKRIRSYCEMMGLELVYLAIEEGVSASKPLKNRPEGAKILQIIKKENVGHVVALKLDRLFRSTVDALNQTKEWDKQGVALHMIDMGGQTIDTSSAVGRLFLTMTAGFAEMERALISERTAAALGHKKETRQAYSHTPYGFDRVGDNLIANEEEQQVIRKMVEWRNSGLSFRAIVTHLNEQNIPTKLGKSWHAPSVRYIIVNDSLHDYEMVEGGF